jgi:uncharacterized protein (TIGR00730 family)
MTEAHPRRIVTVLGGSRAAEDSPDYRDAYCLGRLLAEHGYTLCNGGYDGTMAAAARGAKEAGGRCIGVTVETFSGLSPNPWIDEEINTATLFARLEQLVTLGDAYIALRGGTGTLLELALVWNLRTLHPVPHKPIIALGAAWQRVLRYLPRHLAVRPEDLAVITCVATPEAAVAYLDRYFAGALEPSAPRPGARATRSTAWLPH